MSLGEGDNDDYSASFPKKFCANVQSDDRNIRKKAFSEFSSYVSNVENTPEEFHKIFNETHIYVLNGIRDKSEPVREQAIVFISKFILDILPGNDYYLSYVFPVLTERLGSCEIIEESEEIRLQLVKFLVAVIEKYSDKNQLKPFLEDFVTILKETVQDKYPSIKETSCQCIVKLAQALPRDFTTQAEVLVKPIISNFGHQRFKIRCEAIKCIGEVILHCSYKGLDEVTGPLAERLFDQIPVVRRTVAQVAARWLLDYRDRYSFWHKLLPLILTGLNDEVVETRDEAYQLWSVIGMQYQNENENDLKDQLDFLIEPPKYYIPDLKRPNLGCRILVQRNVSRLAKALSKELASWQADVRVRCSQLLCSVVHHAEEGITHNLQDLLPAMYTAARDDDRRVSDNVVRASEIIGLFVPVKTWSQIIVPAIEDGTHYGHLMVLAALIRGAPMENIEGYLEEMAVLLAGKHICQSRKMKYQRELVKCAEALMSKFDPSGTPSTFGQRLFTILITTIALKDPENSQIDLELLETLRDVLKYENKYQLWSNYLAMLLEDIRTDAKNWTIVTAERCIFEVILLQSDEAFGEHLKVIGHILVDALNIDSDAESRLKTFMALSQAMDAKDVIFKRAGGDLNEFLEILVIEVFVPSLVWHAGRTAEAMRTMAASCLFSALNPNADVELFLDGEILRPLFDKLLPLLLSLSQDASYRSRQLAMQDLVLLKQTAQRRQIWKLDDFGKVYPEILKRLDDPSDKVRICAIKSLGAVLESVPEGFTNDTYKGHHGYLIDTLLVHFDDEDEDFQELILGVLKSLVNICGKALKEKLKTHKPLVRNQKGCEEIEDYLNGLSLQESEETPDQV